MKSKGVRKISYSHVRRVLKNKAEKNLSKERILVTVASVKQDLYKDEGIEVSRDTIRDNGMCKSGYFEKTYSSCKYRSKGDPNRRGLVLEPSKFLDEVEN